MSSVVISGDTSGAITLAAPAVAGTNTITLPAGTGTVALTSGLPSSSQLCQAWVNFNGVGSTSIRASYNVSSVTYNASSDYTVNFTTALTDANYCVVTCSGGNYSTTAPAYMVANRNGATGAEVAPTSSACRINSVYGAGTAFDTKYAYAAFFR